MYRCTKICHLTRQRLFGTTVQCVYSSNKANQMMQIHVSTLVTSILETLHPDWAHWARGLTGLCVFEGAAVFLHISVAVGD